MKIHENPRAIRPESELEKTIISSEIFLEAASFGNVRKGHEEAQVGTHIKQIHDYIDKQYWELQREELRLLGLLHDLGKYKVKLSQNGHVIGKGHSELSVEIARGFISNEEILRIIGIHDKYFQFYIASQIGKFKPEKFIRTYTQTDLNLLTKFNYADSNNREKDSVVWYEDKCQELGLKQDKIYEQEPGVLI